MYIVQGPERLCCRYPRELMPIAAFIVDVASTVVPAHQLIKQPLPSPSSSSRSRSSSSSMMLQRVRP